MQVTAYAHEVGEVLDVLLGEPLVELFDDVVRQHRPDLLVQGQQLFQHLLEVLTIFDRVFLGIVERHRSGAVGLHVGLLGFQVALHLLHQRFHALHFGDIVGRGAISIRAIGESVGGSTGSVGFRCFQELLDVFDLLLPFLRSAVEDVAIGELRHRVGQVADIEGARVHLAVVRLHAPHVLVEVTADVVFLAKAGAHGLAVDGALRGVEVLVPIGARHEFEVLVGVHAPQVHRVGHVVVQVFEFHGAEHVRQRHHRIVVAAEVQVVLVDHHVGRAGTGGAETVFVARAVGRIAHERRVRPLAVGAFLAAEQRERLLVIRGAGDDGDIQAIVERHHIPDGATEDVVGVVVRRIVQQILLCGDGTERVGAGGRIGGSHDVRALGANHTGDELVVHHGQASNARGNARGHTAALVHDLGGIVLRIDFQQIRSALRGRGEVQLVVEFDGRTVAVHVHLAAGGDLDRRHDDLRLAGLGVDLQQQAVVLAVIEIQLAVEQHINARLELRVGCAQIVGDVLECGAHRGIAGAHVHPVAVSERRPGVALAAIGVAVGHCRIAVLVNIDDAVVLAETIARMGDFGGGVSRALLHGDARGIGGCDGNREQHGTSGNSGNYSFAQSCLISLHNILSVV